MLGVHHFHRVTTIGADEPSWDHDDGVECHILGDVVTQPPTQPLQIGLHLIERLAVFPVGKPKQLAVLLDLMGSLTLFARSLGSGLGLDDVNSA